MDKTIDYSPNSRYFRKDRLKSFDLLKFFAIFLVLWGHSIQYFLSSIYYEEPVYRFIYSFHMPLFMMISGYFSVSSISLNFGQFLKKKSIQLLLPSASWGIILWIWFSFYSFLQTRMYDFHIYQLWRILIFEFWFLKSCFFCYLLAFCGYYVMRGQLIWVFVTLLISQFLSIFHLWIMYPCFMIGFLLKKDMALLCHISKYYYLYAFLFMIMLCFWDSSFWTHDSSLYDVIIGLKDADFSPLCSWSYRIYRLTIGVVGSFLFIGLFHNLFNQANSRIVLIGCVFGQYTMEIYVLQLIIIESILSCYLKFDNQNHLIYTFIIAPLTSVIFIILIVYFVKAISKSPYLRFFLFGKITKELK